MKRYYHRVESGQLVPAETRLVDALAGLLGAQPADVFAWRPRPIAAQAAYFRAEAPEAASPKMPAPVPEDEVDRLFRPR